MLKIDSESIIHMMSFILLSLIIFLSIVLTVFNYSFISVKGMLYSVAYCSAYEPFIPYMVNL